MENSVTAAPKDVRAIPLREEISRRAHQIWEENGQPNGRDDEFWLTAEREVLGADQSIRAEGKGAVDAKQFSESTDANGAKAKRKEKK
jgi:DUF2934 family protein